MSSKVFDLVGGKCKLILFGTGGAAQKFVENTGTEVEFYLDNNSLKWGETYNGRPIHSPEILKTINKNEYKVIIASMYYSDISKQLIGYGMSEDVDYFDSELILILYDESSESPGNKIVTPVSINYPITNKCNYRCAMCNVWKPEYAAHRDLSPEEINNLFGKPLFQSLEHVGISGGEPFVRKDIVEVVRAIVDALPLLRSLSIISNASLDNMIDRVKEIKELLFDRNIEFTLQISIDGIGHVHDKNRGVPRAFERTSRNFKALNELGVVNEISTTITKNNYSELWDIYKFAKDQGVYIRFRLASLIGRLYNDDLAHNFTFNKIERLTIVKFLDNINHYYEKGLEKRIFYKSLQGQLQGQKRKSGCYWKTSKGLSLDPYGNLFFCFPKSKTIANVSGEEKYTISLLRENEHVLEEALTHCDSCTHDYKGPVLSEGARLIYDPIKKHRDNYASNTKLLEQYEKEIAEIQTSSKVKHVSVVGWYGTETLGDKAILAGIILNLIRDGIELQHITVVSLNPLLTELTMIELNMDAVRVVDTYQVKQDLEYIASQDLYIFGGGPLCDVEPLIDIMQIFVQAKSMNKGTMIYSCGIGPLHQPRYQRALNILLNHTDKASFRDVNSIIKYRSVLPALDRFEDRSFIDPATRYLTENLKVSDGPIIDGEYTLFSFRTWPKMYAEGLSEQQYAEIEREFEKSMVDAINSCLSKGKKVVLMPMHNYFEGDDDREYYWHIMQQLSSTERVVLITHDYTPLESLNYFKYARNAVCMRFHSVVFAVTCNTPCIAIDYHYGKGKVSGFMSLFNLGSLVYGLDEWIAFNKDQLSDRLEDIEVDWSSVNKIIEHANDEMRSYMSIH